jgi:hypothetical protein
MLTDETALASNGMNAVGFAQERQICLALWVPCLFSTLVAYERMALEYLPNELATNANSCIIIARLCVAHEIGHGRFQPSGLWKWFSRK